MEAVVMVMQQTLLEQEADARRAESSAPSLHRSQLIDGILSRNPTADPSFLMGFNDQALRHYLDHLGCAEEPRRASSRWVRHEGSAVAWWRDNRD